jgi:hypothetical protein
VIRLVLANENKDRLKGLYSDFGSDSPNLERMKEVIDEPLSTHFDQKHKLETLLELGIKPFNKVVFQFLKDTSYPLSKAEYFPLIKNEDNLIRDDIFRILRESGVGVPAYYEKREYQVEIEGETKTGYYSRSRSGCFFCFFQQKIEWVWLYENHPDLFAKAMEYEKDGYTWQQGETLAELAKDDRRDSIKREHYIRMQRQKANHSSPFLLDILDDAEGEGCAACFI